MIEPQKLAFNILGILQKNPAEYRNFGAYWFFIKDFLKKFYTQDNLYLLGDYVDPSVVDRMPEHAGLQDALQAALAEYQENRMYRAGSNVLSDHHGESFTLIDEDARL